MRIQGTITALIVSGTVLAQVPSRGGALESQIATGAEVVIAASNGFKALDPALRNLLAPVLTTLITDARDLAIESGVEKIPIEIREALIDFVPHDILEDVRWRVDNNPLSMGHVSAIAFDHVILFFDADDAFDPKLWAHEIFHVMQYREWGVDGFVTRYLGDRAAVERDAWDFRWQWMEATNRVPSP